MNFLTKLVALVVLIAIAGFVLLHVLPWLLGTLALFGAFKLHQAFTNRRPPEQPVADRPSQPAVRNTPTRPAPHSDCAGAKALGVSPAMVTYRLHGPIGKEHREA